MQGWAFFVLLRGTQTFEACNEKDQQLKGDQVLKYIERYNKRLDEYKQLEDNNKQASTYNVNELVTFLKVRKKRSDGGMPATSAKLKELYEAIKDREPLTLREYLLDEGKDGQLVDSLLAKEDSLGDNNNNIVAEDVSFENIEMQML